MSFIKPARLPAVLPTGFFSGAPDLGVEIWSPNDRSPLVEQKVWQYLNAGAPEVWVIHPEHRTVTSRRPNASAERSEVDPVLSGGEVVPGFSCQVAELFEQ